MRLPGSTHRPRLDLLLPAALLLAGTATFLGGGRRHPHINDSLGPIGSDDFYLAFARTIVHIPNWETMHALILAGPVLWALGAAAIVRLLPGRVSTLGEVGRAALLLAALTWTVAFVFDGFIAPRLAGPIVGAASAAELSVGLAPFRINQYVVARMGMVSLVLIGGAVTALALALLGAARAASWRAIVGASGLLVGLWPLAGAARGDFAPGPFTSPYWTPMALAIGAWFAMLASAVPALGRAREPARAVPVGPADPLHAEAVG